MVKVDLHFIFYKKNVHTGITKGSFLVKIFSLYTNTFLASFWQVTNASSIKGVFLTA
jgi:hypothetical protein